MPAKKIKNVRKAAEVKPVVPPMVISFNRLPFTFDENVIAQRLALVTKGNMTAVPPILPKPPMPANGKHRAYLPGVPYPVSLGYAVEVLTGIKPQGISKAGNPKGAYHPQQAMDMLSKLAAFGVRVESDSDNPRYHKHSAKAAEAWERQKAAILAAQMPVIVPPPAPVVTRKTARKTAVKTARKTNKR